MKKTLVGIATLCSVVFFPAHVSAHSIKEQLASTLFGESNPFFLAIEGRPLLSADPIRFGEPILAIGNIGSVVTKAMGEEIISESAVVPAPSGTAGFAYEYNPAVDVFERKSIGLGTIFNERANTVGKGYFAFGVAYVRQDFDEYNGEDLSNLRIREGLFAESPFLGVIIDSGEVAATLDLEVTTNSAAIWAIYGLTSWLDLSFLLPVTTIDLRARSTVRQVSNTLIEGLPAFLTDSQCTSERATLGQCNLSDFILLRQGTLFTITDPRTGEETSEFSDKVDETRSGVGDLILRSKARFLEGDWGAFGGLIDLTFPTGDEDNFLGDNAFKASFLLLYSRNLFDNRLNFHLNGGGRATTQTSRKNTLKYGSTLDWKVKDWLSLIAELSGTWRVNPEGLPDNFIDGAFGFKLNPWRGLIVSATFRLPATNDGLRSDLIYLAGLEYDFG